MSTQLLPGYADVISGDKLEELCPDEYKKFMEEVEDLEEFAKDDSSWTTEAFKKLKAAFANKCGMELGIEYIWDLVDEDAEEGVFWLILDSYVPNPKLKDHDIKIKRVWQVCCG